MPEAGGGSASAAEDGGVLESDVEGIGGEGGDAAMVAEGADGNEGAGGEGRENVCLTGLWREHRKVEERGVCRVDGAAIG